MATHPVSGRQHSSKGGTASRLAGAAMNYIDPRTGRPAGKRHHSRGITARELKGFRKVSNLLAKYFHKAPRSMKHGGTKGRR